VNTDGNLKSMALMALLDILKKPIKTDSDVARGISIIEESSIGAPSVKLLTANLPKNRARRIGITGAPGVGKSTFLNSMFNSQDFSKFRVAVIAIDPSSQRSKGAVLGDRIRITDGSIFEDIYFRSMATRGSLGGVNNSLEAVLDFLEACAFTFILVETVGVGQNEVQVANHVDIVLQVIDSSSGDEVQMEKSGLMEFSDIFFINSRKGQADEYFLSNLEAFATSTTNLRGEKPIIVFGSALSGEGFSTIWELLNQASRYSDDAKGE